MDSKFRKHKKSTITSRGWFAQPELRWSQGTFINCDLRYFDSSLLGGRFGVIYMDPPWQPTRSGNEPESRFGNPDYYQTLSDQEIKDISIQKISHAGFLFMWVPSSKFEVGLDCLAFWGYSYVDRIVWVKLTSENCIAVDTGDLVMQSSDLCLVGMKGSSQHSIEYIHKVSNDVFFAPPGIRGRRPDQIYAIMEAMMPGAAKVELFGCNHNIRPGWLTIGNELGEFFDWDCDWITCDGCAQLIKLNETRYKARYQANLDLCQRCIDARGLAKSDFFSLHNRLNKMQFHQYITCKECNCSPLWGLRFCCLDCPSFDLCEGCYDKELQWNGSIHKNVHRFLLVEVPEQATGLMIHRKRCGGCDTHPILGYCFTCETCQSLQLCQQCFFAQRFPSTHATTHDMKIDIVEADTNSQCVTCEREVGRTHYICNSCFGLVLCEWCYGERNLNLDRFPTHSSAHSFSCAESE